MSIVDIDCTIKKTKVVQILIILYKYEIKVFKVFFKIINCHLNLIMSFTSVEGKVAFVSGKFTRY